MSDDQDFPQTRWQRENWGRDASDQYVYILGRINGFYEVDGPVKIGISNNPLARMQTLQTGSSDRLVLISRHAFWRRRHAEIVERTFHHAMGAYRLEGEWFDLLPRDAIGVMGMVLNAFITQYLQPDDTHDFYSASDHLGVPGFMVAIDVERQFPS